MAEYRLHDAIALLSRTPHALRELLLGLPDAWTRANRGAGTWHACEVVAHLIHGERTDWIPRVDHLLTHGERVPFPVFDREGGFEEFADTDLAALLQAFAGLRTGSLARLQELRLTEADLDRRALHPALGSVTLRQHLATWVAHDLSHIAQVARTMAWQYVDAVGPWRQFLSILKETGHP